MAISLYDIGDGIRSTVTFKNLSGALEDPTTVVFKLLDPSGTITSPTVIHSSTGLYYADFQATNLPGSWSYRWEGSGAVQAADEGKFTVKQSVFPL